MPLNLGAPLSLGAVVDTTQPLVVQAGASLGGLTGVGVNATVGNATVDNDGQIVSGGLLGGLLSGTHADAVDLGAGGTVDNGAGAVIDGTANGITVAGGPGIVDNSTATSQITGAVDGVAMTAGGTVTNAGGLIQGAANGVSIAGTGANTPSTVTNSGTISATGPNGVGVNLLDGGVVIDSGTISGSDASGAPGGVAVKLGGTGGSKLVLDAGAVLGGGTQAAGTGNVLEIASGAAGTALNDIGTTMTGFDTTQVDAGSALDVADGITAPGTVTLGDGASLTVGGPVAAGVDIDLGAGSAKVTLGDPAAFAGTIQNLGTDDTLDLGALGTGATVAYDPTKGGLVVTTAGGVTSLIPVTIAAGLDPLGVTLTTGSDGNGGLTVTVGSGGNGGSNNGGGGNNGRGGGGDTGNGGGGNGGGNGSNGGGTAGNGGGGTTVTTDPATGATTVVTTSPLGATTTQTLTPGSTVAQGTGAAAGDVISVDPYAAFGGQGRFAITGHVLADSGVQNVTISAVVDGGASKVLGTATVTANGSYTFVDRVGPHLQGFITATETDGLGASTSVQSPYSLQAGLKGSERVAQQVNYTPDGDAETAELNYKRDGSSSIQVLDQGQTYRSNYLDTFHDGGEPGNTFVFNQGYGHDVVDLFRANGPDHDTVSLPSADFADMAAVMSATHAVAGGVVIADPNTGDTVKLTGVSKAELKANPSDVAFHA